MSGSDHTAEPNYSASTQHWLSRWQMWRRHTLKQHHCQVLFSNWTMRVKQHILHGWVITVFLWNTRDILASIISFLHLQQSAGKSRCIMADKVSQHYSWWELPPSSWLLSSCDASERISCVFILSSKNGKGPEPLLIQMFGSNVVCAKWTLTACLSHYSTQRSTPTLSSKSTNSLPFTSHSPEPK